MTDIYLPPLSPQPSVCSDVSSPPPRIQILRIYTPVGATVSVGDEICDYSVKIPVYAKNIEGSDTGIGNGPRTGDGLWVFKSTFKTLKSSAAGPILEWHVAEKQTLVGEKQIKQPLLQVGLDSTCAHPIKFKGMCALCGLDLNKSSTLPDRLTKSSAPDEFSILHRYNGVTINFEQAILVEDETSKRLKAKKKLSLILDLDQTIIHSSIDPTVEEWMKDTSNVNHSAVSDVNVFYLPNDFPQNGIAGFHYFMKQRRGLQEFLTVISSLYEIHVYTMGTRNYAEAVCQAIDPDGTFFCGRILTRDESGNTTQKSIERLFPASDHSMVVIVDDRADVWNHSPNLVQAIPYEFYPQTGDINSSALRLDASKKQPGVSKTSQKVKKPFSEDSETEIKQNVSSTEQQAAFILQLQERPLAQQQAKSNQEHAKKSPSVSSHTTATSLPAESFFGHSPGTIPMSVSGQDELVDLGSRGVSLISESSDDKAIPIASSSKITLEMLSNGKLQKKRQATTSIEDEKIAFGDEVVSNASADAVAILQDNDTELSRLSKTLQEIHRQFYDIHEGRVNVQAIIQSMKVEVLRDCRIYFSASLNHRNADERRRLSKLATEFGAVYEREYNSHVTHVVATLFRSNTINVALHEKKHVVQSAWLEQSAEHWERLKEDAYAIKIEDLRDAPDNAYPGKHEFSNDKPGFLQIDWMAMNEEVDAAMDESDDDNEDEELLQIYGDPLNRKRSSHHHEQESENEGSDQDIPPPTKRLRREPEDHPSILRMVTFDNLDDHESVATDSEDYTDFDEQFAAFEKDLEENVT